MSRRRATKFVLSRQQHFISRLVKLFKTVQKESGNRRKKVSGVNRGRGKTVGEVCLAQGSVKWYEH